MAGTSIASQLQTIRAALNISIEPEPGKKRPFTRPSILFDAKEAADIDLDTILNNALSGLEALISVEERFRNYKNDLFSYQSKELDRELMGQEENRRINASISSYLRLLSGYLELHSALKTLEYLIRRYKVHVYNKEDLILCGLPYHDTHVFVQIMQLIDTGNSRWKFLDGVKLSGARPPRVVIVQQCIRDMGVLEAICNYATPTKKNQPSKPVIGFCTAVIFEILGLATVNSDMVKRILPYLSSSLQPVSRGFDQKAGALMVVSLLAQKAALSPNIAKSLLHLVADTARADTKDGHDLQWLRMSIVALITIVQIFALPSLGLFLFKLQHVESIPKKTIDVLNKVSDISGIVSALSLEFNIEKFLSVLVDSLIEYSASDDTCGRILLSLIETVPLKALVNRIASRLLAMQLKGSRDKTNPTLTESGSQGKQILTYLCAKYPNESQGAIFSFLKVTKPKNLNSSYDILCRILDDHFASSHEVPDPKLFFTLEHSEAEIRRLAVSSLGKISISKEKAAGSKKFVAVQDALFRRLYDDDLNVVLEVLSLNSFPDIISTPLLVEALQHVLKKCTELLLSSSSTKTSVDTDAAFACLQKVVRNFKNQEGYMTILATMIFPLLLVRPKTLMHNLNALELAKELSWPFYDNLALPNSGKELELGCISSVNFENINKLGEIFSLSWEEYMPWLVKCCNSHELSKTFFFLVLLQSMKILKKGQFLLFFASCFPFIKNEWEMQESSVISMEQSREKIMYSDCKGILEDLLDAEIKGLNSEILVCLFWGLLEALIETMPGDAPSAMKGTWSSALQDLFLFFTCHSKDLFKKHLEFLVAKCKVSFSRILLDMITREGLPYAVQVESLHSLSNICSQLNEGLAHQVLSEFPSLLVPLSSDNQNVRLAAMNCIEKLYALWSRVNRNGNSGAVLHFLGEFLRLIIQQKKMILSDTNVLGALFTSLLSSSSDSLLVQQVGKRFDDSTKDAILVFIIDHALGLPAYPKLKILSLFRGVGSKLMSIPGIRSLLSDLLETYQHTLMDGKLSRKLSQCETDISCLLLESCSRATSSHELHNFEEFILKALWINAGDGCVAVEPCRTVLRNLSSSLYATMKTATQVLVFHNLLILFRSAHGDIQNSAREAILRINLDCSVVGQVLDSILNQKTCPTGSPHGKKQKKSVNRSDPNRCYDATRKKENKLTNLSALLDVLLMKKNIKNRTSLIGPLLKLLGLMFTSDEWIPKAADKDEADMPFCGSSDTIADTTAYIQQTLLLTLEDISNSIGIDALQEDILQNFDLRLLINCARTSTDAVTRNHVFSLITALVKIMPDSVLDQVFDILSAIGESTITQWDSYSQRVFEGLISAIIPFWLTRNNDVDKLLQIFVDLMPKVAEHRRVSIIAHILSTLGEAESLGSMLFLLFRSMISRMSSLSSVSSDQSLDHLSLVTSKQWEYEFAVQLCGHYSCTIWLRSLIILLKKIGGSILNEGNFVQVLVAIQFISDKVQDPEISYIRESEQDLNHIQIMIGELMEQVVCHQQLVDTARKHSGIPATVKSELKICIRAVLRILIKGLPSSIYFKVVIKLIGHEDRDVRKKALGLLSETLKDLDTNKRLEKKRSVSSLRSSWLQLNEASLELVDSLTLEVLKLIDDTGDGSSTSLKVAAISALEVLANRFPSQDRVFSTCLQRICESICSDNSALSSHCLLATGALINALGPRSLPELPNVMGSLLKKSRDIYSLPVKTMKITKSAAPSANSVDSVFMSILLTLEAVIGKLAGFLNPYLVDILRLVVLHPQSFSPSEPKLKSKAGALRELITEKIPVRLLLPPVLIMHTDAVRSGDSSVSVLFEMLGKLVGSIDRSSIGAYHAKIFDLCLLALDLRHQNPASIQNIDAVEQNVINTFVTLTMKLTETMFRPLFVKTVEWSGSTLDSFGTEEAASRTISFYNLVNKLAESHRSLFVPYFKYLIDGCVKGLVDTDDTMSSVTHKKRKKSTDTVCAVSLQVWHLRVLILTALHKCFLYDTGSSKFLDSSKFQVLLKPVVSQLVVDPPESIEDHPSIPSVGEVDDMLVACVGQMAVAAGSDLLWKPLNHEVLMQTRSEKIRARILGLRIVKYLVENLREEYLVFLPETIPFLGELLEDVELPVKSLAQEILLAMETMSGESLRQYL